MTDKQFVDGLMVKAPHENAPDFVKCKIAINRETLSQWLTKIPDEWINIDVKVAKSGKWYAEIDTWKPQSDKQAPAQAPAKLEFDDDIPF